MIAILVGMATELEIKLRFKKIIAPRSLNGTGHILANSLMVMRMTGITIMRARRAISNWTQVDENLLGSTDLV